MKIKGKAKKILIGLTSFILLSFCIGYYGLYILPGQLAYSTLNNFEITFYDGKPESSLKYVHQDSYLTESIKKIINKKTNDFFRFERGFNVTRSWWGYGKILNKPTNQFMIWGYLAKVAKIDGVKRDYFEFTLLREEGEWKIVQYAFPDYIDY